MTKMFLKWLSEILTDLRLSKEQCNLQYDQLNIILIKRLLKLNQKQMIIRYSRKFIWEYC